MTIRAEAQSGPRYGQTPGAVAGLRGSIAETRPLIGVATASNADPTPGASNPTEASDPGEAPATLDPGDQGRDDQTGRQQEDGRPLPQDGDLAEREPPPLRDGIVDVTDRQAASDGVDPATVDTRTEDEVRLFEADPPSNDALLFQIEDLEPILDRRPERLYRFEPYDPVGIRAGSFVLFPELETSGVFFSNTFRSTRARSDVAFDVSPSARLVSNWSRHALEFRANGLLTYFNEFPSEDDRAYTIEARGRLDISRRTNIQAVLSREVAQESRSAPNGRAIGTRADETTDRLLVSANHRFNRLSLQLRGSVSDQAFSSTTDGAVVTSNAARDYVETVQAARATWEFKPTLSVFGEVAINQRDYRRPDDSGLDRSSDGERYRAGLAFASADRTPGERGAGPVLAGEISLGHGGQRPRSARLPEVSGVILDSTLTIRPSALTAVAFNAQSGFDESEDDGVGGIKTQSYGIEVRHELRRYLIGTAGVVATVSDYQGSSLRETETQLTAGLEYFLSRETILFGRYRHTNFESNAPGSDYTNDELRIGMRLRR